MKNLKQNVCLVLILPSISLLVGCGGQSSCGKVLIPDWTDVSVAPFNPSEPMGIINPVLSAADVTDRKAKFLADPFLFYENGKWYMFFQLDSAEPGYGEIGLATSSNGLNWAYDKVVLSGGEHHSYPLVLKYKGEYYMFPETYTSNEVRVYKASNFPYNWKYVSTVLKGRFFVDSTVFRYNDTWWMFTGDGNNKYCYLYYSKHLTSGWVEHPKSPIVDNNLSKARPAGRTLVLKDNRIIRLAQKSDVMYGEKIRAFEVDVLTKTDYAEHEVSESPILEADGTGWNSLSVHQADPWWTGDKWVIVVDANKGNKQYSLGIYTAEKK